MVSVGFLSLEFSYFLNPVSPNIVFFFVVRASVSARICETLFRFCAYKHVLLSYGIANRRNDLFDMFLSIDKSFEESFSYFETGFMFLSYPFTRVALTANVISVEALLNIFYTSVEYIMFSDFFSKAHKRPTRLKGILSFLLALILSSFRILKLKKRSSIDMQFLASRFDSLLALNPIPLLETIFPMDGEGPISIPF